MSATELSLLPTEVVEDVQSAVRELLADRCEPAAAIACGDGDRTVVGPLWRGIAVELGLAGLLVPESLGGHGAGPVEAAAVAEELGAAAAPVPFLTSAVLATAVLLPPAGSGPEESGPEVSAAADLLRDLASGSTTAALVLPWTTPPAGAVGLAGDRAVVRSVAGALEADVLLLPVRTPSGVEVRAYPVAAASVTVTPVVSLDMTRQLADVEVDLAADPGSVVVRPSDGEAAVRRGLRCAAAVLASEQAGVARAALTSTVEYLKERRQFGRPVGGFQALKHRLADLWVEAGSASAAAAWAAATLAAVGDEGECDLAVAVAAAYCSEVAVHAAEEMVQLHGGTAMTWEHPAHLLLKRAKADELALGTPEHHRAVVARVADIPPP